MAEANMERNNTVSHEPIKRRKDEKITEMKSQSPRENSDNSRLELVWKQDEQDISIIFKLRPQDGEADKVDIFFTERQMFITLSDGHQQSWSFHSAIEEKKSQIKRKKRKFTVTIVKKKSEMWPDLEADVNSVPTDQEETMADSENMNLDSEGEMPDSLQEVRTKEEEPVMNLQHIKHDFFEKEDVLTVHVYVKSVSKDAVKIYFDRQSFTVKFQTGDARFLQLYGASEDTVFCWKVNTRNPIQPAGCRHKTTTKFIELSLKKATGDRWATLEASLKRESATSGKSTPWMAANQSVATASPSVMEAAAGSSGNVVAFDEMSLMDDNRRDMTSMDSSMSVQSSPYFKSQKPTAKVQPLNKQMEEVAVVQPGFMGLDNIGNTCFMNSVIQVLANTAELRNYFVEGQFQQDINRGNGGELAVCFGVLLRRLWKGTQSSTAPAKLKELISKKVTQFSGWAQHDAQEFLSYLLDNLHEDVNRVAKKAVVPAIDDTTSRPDHEIADEAWAGYQMREDSFLIDLFYGQYKLKIACPSCKQVSSSFDPFSVLPLSLPKNRKSIAVTFMWREPQRKPVKFRVQLIKDSSVEHLTDVLSPKTGVKPKNMRVFEVKNSLFHKRYVNSSDLSSVQPSDHIIVSEVLSREAAGEEVVELEVIQRTMMAHQYPVRCSACRKENKTNVKLKRCTKCLKVGYCDQTCQRAHWQTHRPQCSAAPDPVGCPFYLSLPRSHCTYSCIARLMESFARYSVDTFQPPVKSEPATPTTPVLPTTISTSATTTSAASVAATITTNTTITISATSSSVLGSSSSSGGGGGGSGVGAMLPPSSDLHLPSHTSASNLSSSSGSQSSGSLSSLDSISSCSSTATLTAETPQATFNISHSGEEEDDDEEKEDDESKPSSHGEHGAGDVDSGVGSTSSLQSWPPSQMPCSSAAGGDTGREFAINRDGAMASASERSGPCSNVQSVAASTSQERTVPLFFIKPVTAEGRGVRELDRLDDKGDTVLDMTQYSCLSMDWRNNEKQSSYVLVQSKELDTEEDTSARNGSQVSDNLTLQQCLEQYHAPEILNDRNEWTCAKCKKKQEAVKQYSLWRLPHIFIIQLKRFSQYTTFFSHNKISKMVEFPVRGLDMSPYTSNHEPGDPPALYDLYGVINHHGSVLGGHYTCFARCPDARSEQKTEVGWRLFDDNRVQSVSESKIVQSSAYVLFYRRRAVFSPRVSPRMAVDHKEEVLNDRVEELMKEKGRREETLPLGVNMRHTVCDLNKSDTAAYMDSNMKDSADEKRDLEKEEKDSEDCLVMDMESEPSALLGYTDINAVD